MKIYTELQFYFIAYIYVFETDRGKEFKSAEAKRLYQEKKIVYKYKYGLNKG